MTRHNSNGLSKVTQCKFRLPQYLIRICAQEEICYSAQRFLRWLKSYCNLRVRKCARQIASFCVCEREGTVRTQISWN
jgi:hypothetical protein